MSNLRKNSLPSVFNVRDVFGMSKFCNIFIFMHVQFDVFSFTPVFNIFAFPLCHTRISVCFRISHFREFPIFYCVQFGWCWMVVGSEIDCFDVLANAKVVKTIKTMKTAAQSILSHFPFL